MSNWHYLFFAASVIGAGACFFGIFYHLKRARLIEDIPTSKIRSAAQGYVELHGVATSFDNDLLSAPLSGQPCLWYRYSIQRRTKTGKSSSWRTIENKTSNDLFAIKDTTGLCHIYPKRAEVNSQWKDNWTGRSRHPQKAKQQSMLGSLFSGHYRYIEERIHDGDFLYAVGEFETLSGLSPEQKAKNTMKEMLTQWKQDYDKLIERFDQDGDGKIDMHEWEIARQAAFREAKKQTISEGNDEPIHTLRKSPKQPFILSNKDPKELSSRYRWMTLGMSAAFLGFCWLTYSLFQQLFTIY